MKNRKLMLLFAFSLSCIFSIIYILLFTYCIPSPSQSNNNITIYMNQIGLYKTHANALKMKEELDTKQLDAFVYKKDDLYVVVNGVSQNEDETDKKADELKKYAYSYLIKKVECNHLEIKKNMELKNYQKVLELIGNQN